MRLISSKVPVNVVRRLRVNVNAKVASIGNTIGQRAIVVCVASSMISIRRMGNVGLARVQVLILSVLNVPSIFSLMENAYLSN